MKNIITITLITLTTLFTINVTGQEVKKTAEITIKTSAQCDQCKQRIEKALAYEKGIVSSKLDVPTASITVIYKPTKTNPETIKKVVSKLGYDADDIKADEKAYKELPGCCQKGGMEH
jgi:periplasmic mercuric ion binding protein